jgi:phosphoribosylformylglycinamidine synthase
LSTPATDLPVESANSILELAGQSALSAFRLKKLLTQLQLIDTRITSVSARYSYFVSISKALTPDDREHLDALLLAGDAIEEFPDGAQLIYTAPRPGTISPWSSKATDIAHACRLHGIARIERGTCHALEAGERLSSKDISALGELLFDRMTECLFSSGREASVLFAEHPPAPLATIPLLQDGTDALLRADRELGLALSEDASQFRALQAQDISRRLDHRWGAAGRKTLQHDQEHHGSQPRGCDIGVLGQCRGHGGLGRRAA